MPLRWLAWVAAGWLAGTGCAARAVRQDWRPEQGYEALLRIAGAPLERLADVTAEARIAVEQGGRWQRGEAAIQYRRPDLFRLEVRGPLSSHVLTAVVHAETLTVWGPAVAGAWQGPARGPLLACLTGVDLAGLDLPGAVLGAVQPAAVDSAGPAGAPGPGPSLVRLYGGPGERRLWIDRRRGLVTREAIAGPDGMTRLDRRLGDYRRVGSVLLPRRVEIAYPGGRLRLDYRRYALDRGGAPERLLQGVPREGLRRCE